MSSQNRLGHSTCRSFRAAAVQILRKLDGSSRGFGFVTFVHELSVEKCLVMQHSINGKVRLPGEFLKLCKVCQLSWGRVH